MPTRDELNDPQPRRTMSRRLFLGLSASAAGGAALAGVLPPRRAAADPGCAVTNAISFASADVPFSFVYNGTASSSLLTTWTRTDSSDTSDPTLTRETITWTEPAGSGHQLQVTCQVVQYLDIPTTEWTLWFANIGTADTPALQTVLALDTWVQRTSSQSYLVHTTSGSTASTTDYAVDSVDVEPSTSLRLFTASGGRPTDGVQNSDHASTLVYGGFPYFNLDLGGGTGYIVVLGWPGQWAVQMRRESTPYGLHLLGGMTSRDSSDWGASDLIENGGLLNTVLHAGEEIRTPRIVWQAWECGDWLTSQNTWRRWMLAHNTPRVAGIVPPPIASTSATSLVSGNPLTTFNDTASEQTGAIDQATANRLPAGSGGPWDYWWKDAGWYDERVNGTGSDGNGTPTAWEQTGTWAASPTRFPSGIAPMTSYAHQAKMRAILWHEPERVRAGSWLADNESSWLLTQPSGYVDELGSSGDTLLNLGNPAALSWAVSTFSGIISTAGLEIYRQDFNIDPLALWNNADTTGRSGMTQTLYVMGYLSFWDQLRSAHPTLLIDSCASGGRRNDLETLQRAVPLLRSDLQESATPAQNQTYGLSLWFPIHGSQAVVNDSFDSTHGGDRNYIMRSGFAPAYWSSVDFVTAGQSEWESVRRLTNEWRQIAPNFSGDYYPLTAYSSADTVWAVMQFDRPDLGTGVVLAYRRASCTTASMAPGLSAIDTASGVQYDVEDYAAGTYTRMSGSALAALTVALPAGAGTAVRYAMVRTYAQILTGDAPAGWWRLGEAAGATSIADSSGNGTTGAVSGGVTFGVAGAISGDTNTAASFNGTSGVINLGNPTALQLSSGTVEAWINTTDSDTTDGRTIAIKWMAYGISLYAGKPYVCDWNRGGTAVSIFGSTNVADGQWHHIAMTFQSGVTNGMRIYVDGVLDTVDTITVADQNHDAIIGAANIPATEGFFNGTIDEVAIHPTVLSDAQVRRRFEVGLPIGRYLQTVTTAHPVGWWRLGEASGATSIADSSGNGTTGAVSGGVTFGTAGAISGDTNTAATFNGTSGVINLGNPTALQLSCGTVEAWVKTTDTDTSDSRTIAIKWMAYGISLYAGKPYVCDWNRGGTAVSVFGSTNVADGQWHHIAMTFESGVANGMRIYVDGQLDTVDMITVADQNHDAIIGAGNIPASVGFFNGTLDEVAIYDTAWTASQIQRRYHAGKGS